MKLRVDVPWTVVLGFPMGLLAAVAARLGWSLPGGYLEFLERHPAWRGPCFRAGVTEMVDLLAVMAGLAGAWWLLVSLLGFVRHRWVLTVVRHNFWTVHVCLLIYACAVLEGTGLILPHSLPLNGLPPTALSVFWLRWHFLWPAMAVALAFATLQVLAWRQAVGFTYTGRFREATAPGDRIFENLRSGGRDPAYRSGLLQSAGAHLLLLVVIPWLLTLPACMTPYRIPDGDGRHGSSSMASATAAVRVQTRRVPRKQPRVVVNPRETAILYRTPELEDSPTWQEVARETEQPYSVNPLRVLAGVGVVAGSGNGTAPGWQGGRPGGEGVRRWFPHGSMGQGSPLPSRRSKTTRCDLERLLKGRMNGGFRFTGGDYGLLEAARQFSPYHRVLRRAHQVVLLERIGFQVV